MSKSAQRKFAQTLHPRIYGDLEKFAAEKGAISVQELLRNVVIPEWLHWQKKTELKEGS